MHPVVAFSVLGVITARAAWKGVLTWREGQAARAAQAKKDKIEALLNKVRAEHGINQWVDDDVIDALDEMEANSR